MKIDEVVTEAMPGASKTAALKGAAKQKFSKLKSRATNKLLGTEKQRLAKQNQKKWYDAVKRKQQRNINMNDEDVYRKELHNFVSGNKKLKLDRELTSLIGRAQLTDKTILDIMTKTIDARIAAKQANTSNNTTGSTL